MRLQRFVIGVLFNRKMFRLPSLGGLVIDEILKFSELEKKLGDGFFNQVSTPKTKDGEYSISLTDESRTSTLSILPDQIIFKKSSNSDTAAVGVDRTINEFILLWKAANKIIEFPETRRIGLVGEYRIREKRPGSAGLQLIEALTKFSTPESCSRFHLTFEERSLKADGTIADKDTDDFWNQINTFYISDMDETPAKGELNANIDFQRYFNPAKRDPIREIIQVKEMYLAGKNKFKEDIKRMGLEDQ